MPTKSTTLSDMVTVSALKASCHALAACCSVGKTLCSPPTSMNIMKFVSTRYLDSSSSCRKAIFVTAFMSATVAESSPVPEIS